MNPLLYDIDPGPDVPELVRMIVEIPKTQQISMNMTGN